MIQGLLELSTAETSTRKGLVNPNNREQSTFQISPQPINLRLFPVFAPIIPITFFRDLFAFTSAKRRAKTWFLLLRILKRCPQAKCALKLHRDEKTERSAVLLLNCASIFGIAFDLVFSILGEKSWTLTAVRNYRCCWQRRKFKERKTLQQKRKARTAEKARHMPQRVEH